MLCMDNTKFEALFVRDVLGSVFVIGDVFGSLLEFSDVFGSTFFFGVVYGLHRNRLLSFKH